MNHQRRTDDELPHPYDLEIMANARDFLCITDPKARKEIQNIVEELSPEIDELLEPIDQDS